MKDMKMLGFTHEEARDRVGWRLWSPLKGVAKRRTDTLWSHTSKVIATNACTTPFQFCSISWQKCNKTTLTNLDFCFLILCHQTVTPSPQQYQQDQSQSRVPPPSKAPFDSTSQRFKSMSCTTDGIPGWDIHTYISPMWVPKRADTCVSCDADLGHTLTIQWQTGKWAGRCALDDPDCLRWRKRKSG